SHLDYSSYVIVHSLTTNTSNPTHLSFPTRRSSDLRAFRPGQSCEADSMRHRNYSGSRNHFRSAIASDELQSRFIGSRVRNGAGRDRKSTRLNSSHQIISYAVFCLIKKKQHNAVQII